MPARDRLTTVGGDVIHYECRPGAADVVEPAARFVAGADGRPLLSDLLRLGTGQCSVCRKFRVTIWGTGAGQEPAGPQSREERPTSGAS